MFRHPWHATNHCNTTFPEFMEREWSPGRLAGELLHTLDLEMWRHAYPAAAYHPGL